MKRRLFSQIIAFVLIISFLIPGITLPVTAVTTANDELTGNVALDDSLTKKENPTIYGNTVLRADDPSIAKNSKILNYIDSAQFNAARHTQRLTHLEDLNTYVFANADGTRSVYMMDENVKYIDKSGIVKEKDLTLTSKSGGFGIAQSNMDLLIPNDPVQGIDLAYSGFAVKLTPQGLASTASAIQSGNSVVYEKAYGENTKLKYTPLLSGVKEDIILTEYTDDVTYTFVLETDGLRLYNNGSKYYLAESAKADPVFYLGEIIIYDAIGKPDMGTMTVETVTEGQKYLLTVSANEEFLSDPTTLYPVTIDPSLTVSDTANGINSIEDAPVYAGYPNTKFGAYLFNPIGTPDSTFGIGRTVVRLNGLINSEEYTGIAAHQVQDVTFHILDVSGTASQNVKLHPLTDNTTWTESTVTWNNVGDYNTSANYGTSMGAGTWATFNITGLVKAWKNNTYSQDAGFILVNENEANLKTFASSEYSTASYRPYVTMIYDPTSHGGDGFDDAELITLGAYYTVDIDEEYEIKYFKFVPNSTGFYTFECTSVFSGDPYCRLYNFEETEIAYDNDSASNLKFRLTYHLMSGTTYYFAADCVADSTGIYEFKVTKTTSPSYVDATPLIIRLQEAVFIASPYEAECYKFTPPVDGEYMFISSDNSGDPSIWCYDSSLNLLDDHHNSAGSSNFKLVIKLEQGKTYYIVANEFLDGTGSFFFRTYRSLSYVHYYDSSFASNLTLGGSIVNASAFADYVYSNYFGLKMYRVGSATQYATIIDECPRGDDQCCTTEACGTNCATDHHKNTSVISQQLYDSPREDDRLYVLWTNRDNFTYCHLENNVHAEILGVIACVYDKRPVIHFLKIAGRDSDRRLACMGITLAHETAHTLGMDDVYDNPGHDVGGATVCVMEKFDEESAVDFYQDVLNGLAEPFCDSCERTIRPLIASTVISGNQ